MTEMNMDDISRASRRDWDSTIPQDITIKEGINALRKNGFSHGEAAAILAKLPGNTYTNMKTSIEELNPGYSLQPPVLLDYSLRKGIDSLGPQPTQDQLDAVGKLALNFANAPSDTFDAVKATMTESKNHGFTDQGIIADMAFTLRSKFGGSLDFGESRLMAQTLYVNLFKTP